MNWVYKYMKAADEEHEKDMLSKGYIKIPASLQHIFGYHKYLNTVQVQDLKALLKEVHDSPI